MKSKFSTVLMGLVAIMLFAGSAAAQNTAPVISGVEADRNGLDVTISGAVTDDQPTEEILLWMEWWDGPTKQVRILAYDPTEGSEWDGCTFETTISLPFGTDAVFIKAVDNWGIPLIGLMDVEVVEIPF